MRVAITLLILLSAPIVAFGQLAPETGYVYPPVVRPGATTPVQLGGYDFTPDMQFFVHDSRVKLDVKGPPGKFFIPEPPYWFGPKGGTTAFLIPREVPAAITIPAGFPNGLVHWQVANANGASKTGLFLVSDKPTVLEQRDRDHPQVLTSLPVSIAGRVRKIAEVDQYRFTAKSTGPITVELFARRLGSDFHGALQVVDSSGRILADVADTEGFDASVTFAAKAGEQYTIRLHDVEYRGNRSFVYRLAITTKARKTVSAPIAKTENTLTAPGSVTARMNETGSARFHFDANKGDVFDVSGLSRGIGGRLDISLRVEDATGKRIAANDDSPGTTDAALTLRIRKQGRYTCVVEDHSGGREGSDALFRLSIMRQTESYTLSAPQVVKLPASGKATLTVKAVRTGGFQGEIALDVRGLPADMKVPAGLKIPAKKNSLAIPIERTANAPSHAALIEIVGVGVIGGKRVSRPVSAPTAPKIAPRNPADALTNSIALVTTIPPPYTVELIDKNRQRAVHRGTTYPAEFNIRREQGFTGEVMLQMAAKQSRHRQGIHGPIVVVPAGVNRALYPTFLPEWLETDRTTRMIVMGVAKVKDARGVERYLTKQSDARITMILEGALMKVSQQARELTVTPGTSFEIPIQIARSVKLKGNVTVGLDVPEQLKNQLKCKPIVLSPGTTSGTLTVETTRHPLLSGRWKFVVKANALRDNRWPVISQTNVTVDFPSDSSRTSAEAR